MAVRARPAGGLQDVLQNSAKALRSDAGRATLTAILGAETSYFFVEGFQLKTAETARALHQSALLVIHKPGPR